MNWLILETAEIPHEQTKLMKRLFFCESQLIFHARCSSRLTMYHLVKDVLRLL